MLGLPVESFSAKKIVGLLESLSLNQYSDLVTNKAITGELLSLVESVEDLKQLGIENTMHAKLLLKKLKEMQNPSGSNITQHVLLL